MSNKHVNFNNENHNEQSEETNVATQRNIDTYIKDINNNPLIQQFIQENKLNSKQPHQVNFPVTNFANLDKEKLYDTFIVFQNFLEMVNYSSKNLDFMFHSKLNNDNQIQVDNQSKNNPKTNEEKPAENNQDDVATYQVDRKSNIELKNNENNPNNDEKKEEVEETNYNPETQYRELNPSERKNSVRSERNTGSNNIPYVEANTSRNQEEESTRIRTNDIRMSFKKNQFDSERIAKNETNSASASRMNFRNYEEAQVKAENLNNESEERNLEIAKYEIIDDKSRKVKKVQLKKGVEFPRPTELKNAKSSSVPRREEPKQIKKITARFNFKRNYSTNSKKSNEKVSEEKKKKSGDELTFKHYDKLESEQPSENRPNPYSKNSYRSSSVEKIKSNTNENVLITAESSLKKLQNGKWSQSKYNNENAEEELNEEEGNEVVNESQLSEREDNRAVDKTPGRINQENYTNRQENASSNSKLVYNQDSKRESMENYESLEVKKNPPTMTKKEEEANEEVVEELEDEEDCGLVNYEYQIEDGVSKKSQHVDNSNFENSNHVDNPLIGESALGQSRDLFSSKIIEMTNELIRLKGENEKVLKMKSEYQKLTRKLKLELEELNERREKEMKRLKAESDEFEERRDRELKKLKLDAEEFYERRERESREIEEMREEEMKKIQREKKQLERNIKLNLSIGNRRDKEEIETLKAQISKLQDDHRFKDNTNKLLIERLRKQLEDANAKISLLNKTVEELKSTQKKRMNFSTSSYRANRNKSEIKTTTTLRKTASVKELSTKPKESSSISAKVEKKVENPPQLNYKTEPPKKKVEILIEEVQLDHNSSNYDLIFFEKYHPKQNSLANKVIKTEKTNDGKIIKIYEDGRREILFSSGVRKEVHLDGYQIVYFTNKDIKQTFPDGKSVYFFSEAKTTQTNYPNGLQVFKFENGQIEKHHPDGSKQITFPDGTLRCILEDGYEETLYPDGSIQKIDKNGIVTIEYEDGVKEIKYPDGREIIEYPEGKGKRKISD